RAGEPASGQLFFAPAALRRGDGKGAYRDGFTPSRDRRQRDLSRWTGNPLQAPGGSAAARGTGRAQGGRTPNAGAHPTRQGELERAAVPNAFTARDGAYEKRGATVGAKAEDPTDSKASQLPARRLKRAPNAAQESGLWSDPHGAGVSQTN